MVWLVNCIEYGNSDYDTIEEFLSEEHPELKLPIPEQILLFSFFILSFLMQE